ncbi:MAG: hypothetical protein KIT83_11300 [Bryobacterales bacterium]|nr:hypothetical protein [Bryobacterales bacterium]
MAAFRYRLEVLLEQKLKSLEDAQVAMAERLSKLRQEELRLQQLAREADLARQKHEVARAARYQADGALTAEQLQRRCEESRWLQKEAGWARDAVLEQRMAIEDAQDEVERSRQAVVEANRQVEVLRTHRARQEARFLKGLQRTENAELDDVGTAQYLQRRRE